MRGCMQFAWRPLALPGTPPEGSVVTCEGQLLLGTIGEPLKEFAPNSDLIATVGWSPDGQMLAVGQRCAVLVWHMASGGHFRVKISSQVWHACLCEPCSSSMPLCHPVVSRAALGRSHDSRLPITDKHTLSSQYKLADGEFGGVG
jgi:hypothetical protein